MRILKFRNRILALFKRSPSFYPVRLKRFNWAIDVSCQLHCRKVCRKLQGSLVLPCERFEQSRNVKSASSIRSSRDRQLNFTLHM